MEIEVNDTTAGRDHQPHPPFSSSTERYDTNLLTNNLVRGCDEGRGRSNE
jgi:hypothetical protein